MSRLLRRPGTEFHEPIPGFESAYVVCVQPDVATQKKIGAALAEVQAEVSERDAAAMTVDGSLLEVYRKTFPLVLRGIYGALEGGEQIDLTGDSRGELDDETLGLISPLVDTLWRIVRDSTYLRPADAKNFATRPLGPSASSQTERD